MQGERRDRRLIQADTREDFFVKFHKVAACISSIVAEDIYKIRSSACQLRGRMVPRGSSLDSDRNSDLKSPQSKRNLCLNSMLLFGLMRRAGWGGP